MSQNIAQLSAVRRNQKRKHDDIGTVEPAIYGFATTYAEQWQFLELLPNDIRISERFVCDGQKKESISEIVSFVAGALGAGKKT